MWLFLWGLYSYLRFEVFTAVTMKNTVFWNVTPCGPCENQPHRVLQLLVIANAVPSSLILFTLMMEAISSSVTSVLISATRRHVPEEGFLLYSYCKDYASWS
jgi:hypothetical protein